MGCFRTICIIAFAFMHALAFKRSHYSSNSFSWTISRQLCMTETEADTPTIETSTSTQHFYSKKKFEDIGINPKLLRVLQSMQFTQPSKIQALSFQPITEGGHCIIGDQTGSGKTLAYLLPIIQRIEEQYVNRTLPRPAERAPYVVILTPTVELAE
jgi:superfamily II DNA/RNA helicase